MTENGFSVIYEDHVESESSDAHERLAAIINTAMGMTRGKLKKRLDDEWKTVYSRF